MDNEHDPTDWFFDHPATMALRFGDTVPPYESGAELPYLIPRLNPKVLDLLVDYAEQNPHQNERIEIDLVPEGGPVKRVPSFPLVDFRHPDRKEKGALCLRISGLAAHWIWGRLKVRWEADKADEAIASLRGADAMVDPPITLADRVARLEYLYHQLRHFK